jgi:hypothetical protein
MPRRAGAEHYFKEGAAAEQVSRITMVVQQLLDPVSYLMICY